MLVIVLLLFILTGANDVLCWVRAAGSAQVAMPAPEAAAAVAGVHGFAFRLDVL